MSTDKKGTKILARTFFAQLQAGGYTPNQIIDIASELLEQVTEGLRDDSRVQAAEADVRQSA